LEGLAMENLGIFYDHLDYFRAIGNILWPFGIFLVIWFIFSRFGILDQEKSGNPDLDPILRIPHLQLQHWGSCYDHCFLRFSPIFSKTTFSREILVIFFKQKINKCVYFLF
jgi:hypothetical protein